MSPKAVGVHIDQRSAYCWFAEQIRTNPKHVAAMTGIEELGYLRRINSPVLQSIHRR